MILSRAIFAKRSASAWRRLSAPKSNVGWRRCSRFPLCRLAALRAASRFSSLMRWAICRLGEAARQVAALDRADRAALSRNGVRFGSETVYLEPLLRPEAVRFRALLWAIKFGRPPPALPGARRLAKAIETDPSLPPHFMPRSAFSSPMGWRFAPTGSSALLRQPASFRGLARSQRTTGSRPSPVSRPPHFGGC